MQTFGERKQLFPQLGINLEFHFKFPKCSHFSELSSLKFYNKFPRMGEKPAAFPDISQLLGNRKKYFPNLWLSWYSMTSSQNVPISVKLSSLKFYKKFPRTGKKTCCFSRYFPTFGKRKIYFPKLWFSWYSITSLQNVPKKWGKTLNRISCFPLHFFRALQLPVCFTTEQHSQGICIC